MTINFILVNDIMILTMWLWWIYIL